MILVTGATGHIGNVLVRQLVKENELVKVLVLPEDDLTPIKDLPIQYIKGNILDKKFVKKAFNNVRIVYHLAGVIFIEAGKKKIMQKINVEGTKNVIKACLVNNVERLVYISSIHALKAPVIGKSINESVGFASKKILGAYDRTKAQASVAVLQAVKQHNLNAVLVCPTGVTGPYDYKVSQLGQLYIDYVNKRLKAYLKGAYNYVDVRDVANGLITAAKRGKKGELYILGGETISVQKILEILKEVTNIKPPTFVFPKWLALAVSPLAFVYYKLLKQPPLFTGYSIRTLFSNSDVDCSKAKTELNFKARPINQSIKDSIEWFRTNGKINY